MTQQTVYLESKQIIPSPGRFDSPLVFLEGTNMIFVVANGLI